MSEVNLAAVHHCIPGSRQTLPARFEGFRPSTLGTICPASLGLWTLYSLIAELFPSRFKPIRQQRDMSHLWRGRVALHTERRVKTKRQGGSELASTAPIEFIRTQLLTTSMSCNPSTSSISSATAHSRHRAYTEPEPHHTPLESAVIPPVHHVTIVSQPDVVTQAPTWQLDTSVPAYSAGSSSLRSATVSPSGFGLTPLYDSPTTPTKPRVSARISRRNTLLSRPLTSAPEVEDTSSNGLSRSGSTRRNLPPPVETEAEHYAVDAAEIEAHSATGDVDAVHAQSSTVA
ncbi:hypothetical protein C8Q78DRAFT_1080123 [Trametes maxima]|nr:hypothetical protein C8Q78DRAFT_1080123 [Trametes maxima]